LENPLVVCFSDLLNFDLNDALLVVTMLSMSGSAPPFFFFHSSAIFQLSRRSSDLAVV
jgi:hypothetical protein